MTTRTHRSTTRIACTAAALAVGLTGTALAGGTLGGAANASAPDSASARRPVMTSATSEYTDEGRIRLAFEHRTRPQDRLLGYLADLDTTTATRGEDFYLFWSPSGPPQLRHPDGVATGCRGIKHRTKVDGATRTETFFVPASCLGSAGAAPSRFRARHQLDVQKPDGTCTIDRLPGAQAWQRWLKPGQKTTSVAGSDVAAAARGC